MRAVRRGGGEGIMVGNLVLLDLLCFLKLHGAYKKGQGLGGGISQRFIVSSDVVSSGIIPCAERARTRCFM